MAAVFRDYGEGFYGWFDEDTGGYLGPTQPVSPAINPQVPPPPPPPPPASSIDRAPAPVQYREEIRESGEGYIVVQVPVPALPPPAPLPASSIDRTPAPVGGPPAGPAIPTPAGDPLPGTDTWQIRDQVSRLKDNTQLQAWLATTTFSAAEIAKAYPEFAVADIEAAKNKARTDGRYDPKNPGFADRYSTGELQQFGVLQLPKPVKTDKNGNPIYANDDPALKQAEAIISAEAKIRWDKAVKEIYGQYGLSTDFVISSPGPNGWPSLDITTRDGKIISVPTDKYFEGVPQLGDALFAFAEKRPLTQFETGYLGRVVEITPPLERSVSTQLPDGTNIVVDKDSELARYIQYLSTQPNSIFQRPFADIWAEQGVTDPYTDPATVKYAIDALERTKQRQDDLRAIGITPQESFWNDPNWPAYVGSSKEAFLEATRAFGDPSYAAQLKAANNWSEEDYQSWSRSILNPEEHNRLVAEAERARGMVAGPSSSGNGGTSNYALSANSASVVERPINQFYANGAPVTNVTSVSNNTALNPGVDPSLNPSNLASSFGNVATAALSGFASATAAAAAAQSLISGALTSPTALPSSLSPFVTAVTDTFSSAVDTGLTTVENLFGGQAATLLLAKNQATLQARNNEAATADWRVRLQLGVEADYLYKDAEPGILAPLYDTDGVIFPYMPSIETSYAANYDKFDLTHSNYRGYFYKGSNVNDINLRATFTAQDTQEANYLLAVIHFFRSVTKMFYGQDSYRGAPPPLVFLNGLGNYQFNEHPCFVSNFSYSLPNDVDYIRARAPNNYGNLFSKRERTGSTSGGLLGSVATRLLSAGLNTASPSMPNIPSPGMIQNNVNNIDDATYVPTKMEINITLLPTNTRAQISQQFSLKDFANGNLLKGGFW